MKKNQVESKSNSVSGGTGNKVGNYKHGDRIIIICNPEQIWLLAKDWKCNANGFVDHITTKGNQTFYTGTMVGSFDDGKTFFSVGTYLEITVNALKENKVVDPTLTLYCWDSDNANNSGYIDAYVQKVN